MPLATPRKQSAINESYIKGRQFVVAFPIATPFSSFPYFILDSIVMPAAPKNNTHSGHVVPYEQTEAAFKDLECPMGCGTRGAKSFIRKQ
jgi:hypothetical protein